MTKISVGVLGATGVVGQHYVQLLVNHPWFEVTFLASSERSAGQSYEAAVMGRWRQPEPLPSRIGYNFQCIRLMMLLCSRKVRSRFFGDLGGFSQCA